MSWKNFESSKEKKNQNKIKTNFRSINANEKQKNKFLASIFFFFP